MIYRAVGWCLTAAAGMSNWMLVGCFREEEKVTVRRQWVSLSFFFAGCMISQWIRQTCRQAGNMQCGHGLIGVRTTGGGWREWREMSLKKAFQLWRRGVAWWRWYSLILLRTHADEGDGTVRESRGGREGRYHKTHFRVKKTQQGEEKVENTSVQQLRTQHKGKTCNICHVWLW